MTNDSHRRRAAMSGFYDLDMTYLHSQACTALHCTVLHTVSICSHDEFVCTLFVKFMLQKYHAIVPIYHLI